MKGRERVPRRAGTEEGTTDWKRGTKQRERLE
jgi:hypothetical protein